MPPWEAQGSGGVDGKRSLKMGDVRSSPQNPLGHGGVRLSVPCGLKVPRRQAVRLSSRAQVRMRHIHQARRTDVPSGEPTTVSFALKSSSRAVHSTNQPNNRSIGQLARDQKKKTGSRPEKKPLSVRYHCCCIIPTRGFLNFTPPYPTSIPTVTKNKTATEMQPPPPPPARVKKPRRVRWVVSSPRRPSIRLLFSQ